MKKILVLNGHPDKKSYNYALSDAYRNGAQKVGWITSQINIADLQFNPNLSYGYRERTELENDLVDAIGKIEEADHLVWFFPMWWHSYPAMMKGFIDRTFLPGIAYEYEEGKALPKGLFKGKTARIIVTSDTPKWYNSLIMKNPVINQFKKGTLEYCGIQSVKVTYLAPVSKSSELQRSKWLNQVSLLGKNLK